ncbi:fimbrial protein [Escherichia coli]|nr:fimbrial protein [Escherichia coli]
MKKLIIPCILAAVTGMNACILSAQAASEKEMYLGVVNGLVQGNSVVKVNRTLPEPVLFHADKNDGLPEKLVIRNAGSRMATGGSLWVTVRQAPIPNGGEAKATVKTALIIDGKKIPGNAAQHGNDVVIDVPKAEQSIQLRTDEPIELQIPANYKGEIKVELQIESIEGVPVS